MLRFTLQPRDEPSWMEKDIGHLSNVHDADAIKKVAMAIAAQPGPVSYVRVYDQADICVLTASPAAWAPGYQESLR